MSWMTFALITFFGLWVYERGRSQRLRRENGDLAQRVTHLEGLTSATVDESNVQDEIDTAELVDLRERVQVLERIATDENSTEARKAQQIAREIESLRSDIAQRSSKTKEDLSE
ncbi:MAG: hypothetical protein AAF941_04210 [Pseudomonadota bacterium]